MNAVILVILFARAVLHADTLTLPDAQARMLQNNHQLTSVNHQVDAAKYAIDEARTAWYPNLTVSGSWSFQSEEQQLHIQLPAPMGTLDRSIGDNDRIETGINVSWPLFTGLARIHSMRRAHAAFNNEEQKRMVIKDQLSVQLGLLYFSWELAALNTVNLKDHLDRLQEYRIHVQRLYDAGMAVVAHISQIDAELARAETELIRARMGVDSLRLHIAYLVGRQDTSFTYQQYSMNVDSLMKIDIGKISFENRAVVRGLDYGIQQLQAAAKLVKQAVLPSVKLTAGYYFANPGPVLGEDEFVDYAVVGVNVYWLLYDGMKARAQQQQFIAQQRSVQQQRAAMVNELMKNCAVSHRRLLSAKQQYEAAVVALKAAQRCVIDMKNAFDAGTATSLEYLQALEKQIQACMIRDRANCALKSAALLFEAASGASIDYTE